MKNNSTFLNVTKSLFSLKIPFLLLLGFLSITVSAQTSQIFTTSGSFTVPQGVTSITIDCIGAGGSGGSGRSGFFGSNAGAGGGAGGQYAKSTITVTAGQVYTVKVAGLTAAPTSRNTNGNTGDFSAITLGATTYARANGGYGGIRANDTRSGGVNNATAAIGNIVTRSGGNGGNGTNSASGGGGGGAGTTANGGNASGTTAGTGATLFGGNGGAGQTNTNPGLAGKNYGGGGSGARRSNNGGAGAQGYVQISFTCPTVTSNAGSDQTLAACAISTTLNATAPTYGTGVWAVVSGSGTVTTPASRTSGVTGIVPGVPLVLSWTVTNGSCGSASSNVTITSPVGPGCNSPYCIPAPTSIDGTGITSVVIGTIINTGSRGGNRYNDYTYLSTNVVQSATVPFQLQFITGRRINYYYEVWVDWNNDGDFNDLTEEVAYGYLNNNTLLTSSFRVPTFASAGNHRLRVGIRKAGYPTPCYNSTFAQFEDYTLNVTALCTTGTPSSISNATFINGLASTGTLNDMVSSGSAGYATGGYKNNKSITLAEQIPNGPVNLDIDVTGPDGSFIYVFVDWNNNGNFNDAGETVYATTNFSTGYSVATGDTSFGFIVPAGMVAGDYTMRVRTSPYNNAIPGDGGISPCATGYSSGEAEDFTLKVVADCPSKITSVIPGSSCGPGEITIGATSPGAIQFKWYNAKKGGALLQTTSTGSWTIPSVSATTTYYVTSLNGTCESLYRTPVLATVYPVANITFTPTTPEICGTDTIIKLSATGDSSINDLFVEDFETGLGKFTANQITSSVSSAPWSIKTSSYIPNNTTVFKPAINSGGAGTSGNKFAFTTSDLAANSTVTSSQALETTAAINTVGYTLLTLTFDQYYSHYANDNVYVEVSLNGNPYITVATFSADDGSAGDFKSKTINFTPYINVANLKFRVRYDALWDDGYAVDNFRLYGTKPITSIFDWGENDGTMYTDSFATVPYTDNALVPEIYIKPDITSGATFNYSAETTLPNGCLITTNIPVTNNTKVSTGVSTSWNSTNWLPDNLAPNASKCVVVRNAVTLGTGNAGAAKNLTIEGLGKLTISGDLTVTDFIKNETTPPLSNEANLVLASDANLIQINSGAANTGRMTAQRYVSDMDYNPGSAVDYVYWSSPVFGQKTKNTVGFLDGFSPGTANSNFFYYNESNDRFYETGDPTFRLGRGYAVQAERNRGLTYNHTYEFKGTPNNGDIGFGLAFTNGTHGYNLVGNPYPSNIDFRQLYAGNSSLIYETAYFWTNNVYEQYQMGQGYGGNNYAIFNGTGGNSATTAAGGSGNTTVPDGYIKVGQGFIVQAKSAGTLNFKHKYGVSPDLRVTNPGTFFQKDAPQINRYWLSLLAPSNLLNSQLVGYIAGATEDYEKDYDAEAFSLSSDLFYSVLPTKRLLIQGKSEAFTDADKVTLGANFFQNGSYTIALAYAEGIFNGSQNIYLKDKQEGVVTNLSQGSYSFTATAGDNMTRFEIIYKPETVLATGDGIKDDLIVYRNGNDFVVKSQSKKIDAVELYDTAGRLIYTSHPKNKETLIPGEKLINSTYVLKISRGGEISTKKLLR